MGNKWYLNGLFVCSQHCRARMSQTLVFALTELTAKQGVEYANHLI